MTLLDVVKTARVYRKAVAPDTSKYLVFTRKDKPGVGYRIVLESRYNLLAPQEHFEVNFWLAVTPKTSWEPIGLQPDAIECEEWEIYSGPKTNV